MKIKYYYSCKTTNTMSTTKTFKTGKTVKVVDTKVPKTVKFDNTTHEHGRSSNIDIVSPKHANHVRVKNAKFRKEYYLKHTNLATPSMFLIYNQDITDSTDLVDALRIAMHHPNAKTRFYKLECIIAKRLVLLFDWFFDNHVDIIGNRCNLQMDMITTAIPGLTTSATSVYVGIDICMTFCDLIEQNADKKEFDDYLVKRIASLVNMSFDITSA
jgi:hypothetical protein